DGTAYIVAERADLRHTVAENVVLESVLPLLLWLPVSAVLVWLLVGWGLRPLYDLSRQINARRSDDLAPVALHNPPAELRQLIESTNSLLARLAAAFEREK
ncbi:HAMP domain-containing protein, partial [Roseicella aquatilis]